LVVYFTGIARLSAWLAIFSDERMVKKLAVVGKINLLWLAGVLLPRAA
jgi:hypothetical protein